MHACTQRVLVNMITVILRAFCFAPDYERDYCHASCLLFRARGLLGGGGSFRILEAVKRESVSDIEKWKASMPWMSLDELRLSFGFCQQVPESSMSLRAEARAKAVQKYCERLHMTQVGRVVCPWHGYLQDKHVSIHLIRASTC